MEYSLDCDLETGPINYHLAFLNLSNLYFVIPANAVALGQLDADQATFQLLRNSEIADTEASSG